MKIGIIGSGDVGKSLGSGLALIGHEVMIGSRDPSRNDLKEWHKDSQNKQVGSPTEAAAFGDIAILAVAWHASEDVLSGIRPQLSGKIVIDVTNPLVFDEDDTPQLSIGFTISAGEIVQQILADSHVVKTLNIVNHRSMVQPAFRGGPPVMFLCGNNSSAKKKVRELLIDMGWQDINDIGSIEKARLLEPLCLTWIAYGQLHEETDFNHAFSVIKSK